MSTRDDPVGMPSAAACAWSPDRPETCRAESAFDDRLAESAAAATATVLPIRPRTTHVDGAPLFCLAGEAVLAWNYAGLVAHVDPRVPIYGLQASTEPRTIREYATRYLAEIRGIAPHGPYQLLGWSAGGFVAHEVAVLLRTAGEHVRVVLLATDPLTRPAPTPAALSADRFGPLLGAIDTPTADATTRTADAAAEAINAALAGTIELTGTDLDRIADASTAAVRMVAGHRPSLLPGDLTVCVAGRERDGADHLDPAAAVRHWHPYVGGKVTGFVLDCTPDELATPELLTEIARILAAPSSSARTTC